MGASLSLLIYTLYTLFITLRNRRSLEAKLGIILNKFSEVVVFFYIKTNSMIIRAPYFSLCQRTSSRAPE